MLFITIIVISAISSINAQRFSTRVKPNQSFLVQKGSPIENLHTYPIGKHPVSFLVNYTDPNYESIISNINATHIPIVVGAIDEVIPYNLSNYYSELKTKHFGRNLIFVGDNTPSSMDIAPGFGNIEGLVFIANMHTKGRGSNGTTWSSPKGDIYLNINLKLTNQSQAGLLPIHCALSLISAVLSTPGNYFNLPIKFSWPISITWMPWNKKIGGVLVERTETNESNSFWYTSGCGLRVNSDLEYSLSKMIDEHNARNPNDQLNQLELPSLIARTVNYLEEYYHLLVTDPNAFRQLIMKYWINDEQKVILNVSARIVDITDDGSIVLKDDNGITAYLKPKPERFGFEPVQFIN